MSEWLFGLNAVSGLGGALVWFVYLALSIRESRYGWALLSAGNALIAGYFGVIYFMVLLDPDLSDNLARYLSPVDSLAIGLPALAAYGFLVEGNKTTERALEQIRSHLDDQDSDA